MTKMTDFQTLTTRVAKLCSEILHDLRTLPEDKWTTEDEGIFHLAGAFLMLQKEVGFHRDEVRQLLIASADACTTTVRKYQNVPEALWTDYDKALNLICGVYLKLFSTAVKAHKINLGENNASRLN